MAKWARSVDIVDATEYLTLKWVKSNKISLKTAHWN